MNIFKKKKNHFISIEMSSLDYVYARLEIAVSQRVLNEFNYLERVSKAEGLSFFTKLLHTASGSSFSELEAYEYLEKFSIGTFKK